MRSIVRIGDSTTHGGTVLSGSATMLIRGRGAARKGDCVSCPLHGEAIIIEGSDMLLDRGIPVALHGHACSCGCQLIASLNTDGEC